MVVHLDYNISSGPFLSFEIEIGDGPGPELDNCSLNWGLTDQYGSWKAVGPHFHRTGLLDPHPMLSWVK